MHLSSLLSPLDAAQYADSILGICPYTESLKVDGNEKDVGREGHSTVIQVLYGIVAMGGYFKFELVISL